MSPDDTARPQVKRLLSFVRSRVDSREDAEDIVQDILLRLLEGDLVNTIEDLSAWLFRAARNRIVDLYRRRGRQAESPADEIEAPVTVDEATIEDWNQRFWDAFSSALADLPEEQRLVFEWNELQGKAFRTIAEETGENINTLLSRKRYAVLYLRSQLKDLFEEMQSEV